MNIVILYDGVDGDAPADAQDVLIQAAVVQKTLEELGLTVFRIETSLNLEKTADRLQSYKDGLVFNLVESINTVNRLIHFIPALLEHLEIPFTGSCADAVYTTSHKLMAKQMMRNAGIATPDWWLPSRNSPCPPFPGPYIIKPIYEDASVGLDDTAIVELTGNAAEVLQKRRLQWGPCFAERYIEGREFNISLLAGPAEPQVLPPAEIIFTDYPPDKPRITGYEAKWLPDSFAWNHTPRTFHFAASDRRLITKLKQTAVDCWHLFGMAGYARVDFRVDPDGRPWVLEVNANPCLAPDAGFAASAIQADLSLITVIQNIISAALMKL